MKSISYQHNVHFFTTSDHASKIYQKVTPFEAITLKRIFKGMFLKSCKASEINC